MKFLENSNQAAHYLRLAVPKMIKHDIVPNPLNYALWYSYFSNEFPALNRELEHVIERFDTCPSDVSESLFLQHMVQVDGSAAKSAESVQVALTTMVSNLSQTLDQTAQDTRSYTGAMKSNIDELIAQNDNVQSVSLLDELTANSDAICKVNDQFQLQLDQAQQEINRLKNELENSQKEASTDQLTGLHNRRVLETIYQQFNQTNDDSQLSVIILDIDRFKVFNDTYGHSMGDQVLRFVANLLKSECDNPVTAVRLGGEEFALICPNTNVDKASTLAEKIRHKLEKIAFSHKKTKEKIPPITASFGVALKRRGELLCDLLERADKALYSAKHNGRNQVALASDEVTV